MHKDLDKIIVSEEEIDRLTTRLAAEIDRDYAASDKNLLLLCVLKGSIVFMGDLMKKITVPVEIDCIKISSYGSGTVSGGRINVLLDLSRSDIKDCDILIIEDIIDSGNTLSYLVKHISDMGARSVKTCTLLDKKVNRTADVRIDYCGAVIPNEFVVGYGLDYAEKYRALPYIGVLKPELYCVD